MASIEIPLSLKNFLQEKLLEHEKKTGFHITITNFTCLAIQGENGKTIYESTMNLGHPAGGRTQAIRKDVHLSDGCPN